MGHVRFAYGETREDGVKKDEEIRMKTKVNDQWIGHIERIKEDQIAKE